jgi:DDE superfamily endonuclease
MAEPVRARRLTVEEGQRLGRIARRGRGHPIRVAGRRSFWPRPQAPRCRRSPGWSRPTVLSIRPCHGATWAPETRPVRLPATYHRTHGIRYFHGCYSLGDDQLWGVVRRRKGGDHTLAALRSIRAARPDGAPIYVILDNLSANKTPAIRAWAQRSKVELCFTPTSASWANPIEAQFGPLRTFVMGASNHPNHVVLTRKLQEYLRWRNANARHPDVLAAQRRERARVRSERQQRWGRPRAA